MVLNPCQDRFLRQIQVHSNGAHQKIFKITYKFNHFRRNYFFQNPKKFLTLGVTFLSTAKKRPGKKTLNSRSSIDLRDLNRFNLIQWFGFTIPKLPSKILFTSEVIKSYQKITIFTNIKATIGNPLAKHFLEVCISNKTTHCPRSDFLSRYPVASPYKC